MVLNHLVWVMCPPGVAQGRGCITSLWEAQGLVYGTWAWCMVRAQEAFVELDLSVSKMLHSAGEMAGAQSVHAGLTLPSATWLLHMTD